MGQNIREIHPKSYIFLHFQSILASNTQNLHQPKPAPDHRPPPKNTGPGPKIPAIIPPYKRGHRAPAIDPGLTYGHRPRIYTGPMDTQPKKRTLRPKKRPQAPSVN